MKPLLKDMHPELRPLYDQFKIMTHRMEIHTVLTCIKRTRDEQIAFASQGRTIAQLLEMLNRFSWQEEAVNVRLLALKIPSAFDLCNHLREKAGMYQLLPRDWYEVTWTLNSKHYPDADGYSHAFDIMILSGEHGKPTWQTKFDGNANNVGDYLEAAIIGQALGLEAGGLWKNRKDYPHYQLRMNK